MPINVAQWQWVDVCLFVERSRGRMREVMHALVKQVSTAYCILRNAPAYYVLKLFSFVAAVWAGALIAWRGWREPRFVYGLS